MATNLTPPPDEIKSMIYYHEGELYWFPDQQSKGGRKTDKPIGYVGSDGYKRTAITVNGVQRSYKVHRLIYWLISGEWVEMIDHIDRNKLNNLFSNLESTNVVENGRNRNVNHNSATGYIGVSKDRHNSYRIFITIGGFRKEFSGYKCKETAALARDVLARILYGDKTELNILDKEFKITDPA
ncbi:hypothetical protein CJH86_05480 [Salmonella enterica]|nr:hypothetical protein [Salmonella enterica]EIL8050644.1 HNH endonuclease [Salmonella enterica]ELM4096007.1 HNH endonuclease [Salmonella enterica]